MQTIILTAAILPTIALQTPADRELQLICYLRKCVPASDRFESDWSADETFRKSVRARFDIRGSRWEKYCVQHAARGICTWPTFAVRNKRTVAVRWITGGYRGKSLLLDQLGLRPATPKPVRPAPVRPRPQATPRGEPLPGDTLGPGNLQTPFATVEPNTAEPNTAEPNTTFEQDLAEWQGREHPAEDALQSMREDFEKQLAASESHREQLQEQIAQTTGFVTEALTRHEANDQLQAERPDTAETVEQPPAHEGAEACSDLSDAVGDTESRRRPARVGSNLVDEHAIAVEPRAVGGDRHQPQCRDGGPMGS